MVFMRCVMDHGMRAMWRRRTAAMMGAVVGRVVFRASQRIGARMPRTRAGERDQRRDDAAEQREEEDGLIHRAYALSFVMPGLVPGIPLRRAHTFLVGMAGTSPAMTEYLLLPRTLSPSSS